jgi:hypothetical protein
MAQRWWPGACRPSDVAHRDGGLPERPGQGLAPTGGPVATARRTEAAEVVVRPDAVLEPSGHGDVDVDVRGLVADLVADVGEAEADAPTRARRVWAWGWSGRGRLGLVPGKVRKRLARRQVRRGAGWGLVRVVSGGEWDGRPRTNATWWRFATRPYAWSDRPPARWWFYPRALRATLLWLAVTVAAGVGWAWWHAPAFTARAGGVAAWVVAAVAGWWVIWRGAEEIDPVFGIECEYPTEDWAFSGARYGSYRRASGGGGR